MSLITEALQLRKTAPRVRASAGESLPPLRRTPSTAKAVLVLVFLGGAAGLIFWMWPWADRPTPSLPVAVAPSAPAPSDGNTGQADSAPAGAGVTPTDPAEADTPNPPAVAAEKPTALPAELEPMDVNLTLALIEDERARQQMDEENQRKIESFLRRMDVQGVCHQGDNSTALLDAVLVRPGDPVGDLGLSLKKIETRRLVFADRDGREYTKSY